MLNCKKKYLLILLVLALIFSIPLIGFSSDFPKKNVNIIIPFGSGGGTDQISRVLAGIIEKDSDVNWVCSNLTGGAGAIAMQEITTKKSDGYTIMLLTSNISALKHMGHTSLTYKDYEPIIAVNYDEPALFVHIDSGWETLDEFIAAAKERRLKVQTGAAGGLWQVATLGMEKELGVSLNIIPSGTGGAPATPALLGKQVDAITVPVNEALPGIDTGEFKMLASFGQERSALVPGVPTFAELGYDKLQVMSVRAFYAPKGTPKEIIAILHDKIKQAVDSEQYHEFIKNTGSNVKYMSTDELNNYLKWELDAYKELIDMAGLLKQ